MVRRSNIVCVFALCLGLAAGNTLPTFVFPEEDDDAFFSRNVAAIKHAIRRALDDGCLDTWPIKDEVEIAVVFRHNGIVPDTSDFYIQYQMEQVAAGQATDAVGFRSLAEEIQYQRKLTKALQIWDWSPHQVNFLRTVMPRHVSNKLAYVPLAGGLDAIGGCDNILDETWCQADETPDVLFFGAMTESRRKLCESVDAEMARLASDGHIFLHQCLSEIFGDALQCKVCKTKVIYNAHSREGASLEVHRINPLLALGKAVVSAKSADKVLDVVYGSAVELVDEEEIPKTISKLLLDKSQRMNLERRGFALSQELRRETQPMLCKAFESLVLLVEEVQEWQAPEDWSYLLDRRLQNDTISTPSPPTSVPTPTHPPTPAPAPSPTPSNSRNFSNFTGGGGGGGGGHNISNDTNISNGTNCSNSTNSSNDTNCSAAGAAILPIIPYQADEGFDQALIIVLVLLLLLLLLCCCVLLLLLCCWRREKTEEPLIPDDLPVEEPHGSVIAGMAGIDVVWDGYESESDESIHLSDGSHSDIVVMEETVQFTCGNARRNC